MKTMGSVAMVLVVCLLAPAKAELLTDFTRDLPADDANVTITLVFQEIRPLKGQKAGDIAVQLQWRGGKWADAGHRAAADYNQISPCAVEIRQAGFERDRLTGAIRVMIDKDRPRPNAPVGFPMPPDHFALDFSARIERGTSLPYQSDPESFMPPWRKDMPKFGGDRITGTYKGTWGQGKSADEVKTPQAVEGRILGAVSPACVDGVFGAQGNIVMRRAGDGGVSLLARLSPKRVALPEGARITREWTPPSDWRKFDGLRITVASPKRRDDAAVGVSIREADGTWYSVTGAAMLLGREATFDIPFADFRRGGFDENYFLDVDRINALSIGVDNPLGVGDVEFTVRRIELYSRGAGFGAVPTERVRLSLDPETAVSINGVRDIPKGLFGFHDVNPPKGAAERDPVAYMRQLNPGYLRPLDHVGFSGKPLSDEQIRQMQAERKNAPKPQTMMHARAEAANAVDNTVWCHTVDLWARPPWMDADRAQFLGGVEAFYREKAAGAWVPGDDHNLLRRFEVWNEPFIWGRHINMGPKTPPGKTDWQDPTQFGYIPAKVGTDVYSEIFHAAVKGAKSANPHVLLGGPSAPAFCSDDYSNFENHVARFIDACHDRIDFLTEHHYSGEPDTYAASYVVATAYADVKHNRRFPIYNTECNDLTDPATRGDDGMMEAQRKMVDLNRAYYNAADILACARLCPDIARGRAMHALWSGFCRNKGEEDAYAILSTLRGAQLSVTSSDPAVIAMASSPGEGRVIVLAVNASAHDRKLTFAVPQSLVVESIARLMFHDGTRVTDEKAPVDRTVDDTIQARGVVRWTLVRPGFKPTKTRSIETSYASTVLTRVTPTTSASGRIVWRGAGPAGAKSAFLRVVTHGVDRGEGVAVINGNATPLPWSSSNDSSEVVQDIAIDPAILKDPTTIEFRCADPTHSNGFAVRAAAVGVER